MTLYCGIDLHSNNHVVVVINECDEVLYQKRLGNDISFTIRALEPFKEELEAVAVESTFNWYWLADGLMAKGFDVKLVNTTAVQQYDGLKYSGDEHDARYLTHLMRLGILPTGYIYPELMRPVRDLLRRRKQLVQTASRQLTCIQNQIWRQTGIRVSSSEIKKKHFTIPYLEGYTRQAAEANLAVYRITAQQIKQLEASALSQVQPMKNYELLTNMAGIGSVLGLTILLEIGDIHRFKKVGHFASYCRCVASTRESNGKKKGEGNKKAGNKYLSWAFSEAAHFAVRYDARIKAFYERKRQKRNGIVAIRA
ncbi:IS110 family transposase, partial [Vibrio albus]